MDIDISCKLSPEEIVACYVKTYFLGKKKRLSPKTSLLSYAAIVTSVINPSPAKPGYAVPLETV